MFCLISLIGQSLLTCSLILTPVSFLILIFVLLSILNPLHSLISLVLMHIFPLLHPLRTYWSWNLSLLIAFFRVKWLSLMRKVIWLINLRKRQSRRMPTVHLHSRRTNNFVLRSSNRRKESSHWDSRMHLGWRTHRIGYWLCMRDEYQVGRVRVESRHLADLINLGGMDLRFIPNFLSL